MVEPNVKEGKGGLRDLQTLFWVAKYIHRVEPDRRAGRRSGCFTPEEYDTFQRADEFLWAVRCHLHLITGRAMDQLTFDLQVEVAARHGLRRPRRAPGGRAFHAGLLPPRHPGGRADPDPADRAGSRTTKKEPLLQGLFKRRSKVRAPFVVNQGRLTVASEKDFLADKLNILRMFEEALRTGLLLHPDAMRLVAAHLDMIDDEVRADKEAARIFLDLLLKHGNPERALRRMNELGVLAAFIPEFEPIVAMMQFNMYHAYTVDEHTIQCISALAEIERGERVEELPIASPHPQGGGQPQGALRRAALPRHRQGPRRGPFDPRRPDRPRDRAPAGAVEGRDRNRRMAGALPPADVGRGAETRSLRPAHGARLRQGGAARRSGSTCCWC